ncbi:MAG TPA: TIGR03435 family protein [Bryobacteraceae bacterium]|nr:TIGR03435 family protein [Bryobacteraceae bacterium]
MRTILPAIFLLRSVLPAQSPADSRPEFEVASIKPDTRTAGSWVRFLPGGRLDASSWIKQLVQIAWGVEDYQVVGGPGWITTQWYDIEAKAPDPTAGENQMLPMLQSLLADRFQLKLRREEREFSVMALVTDKNGPKLIPLRDTEQSKCDRDNSYACGIRTTADLARHLRFFVGHPVFDETGITGRYDILLDFDVYTISGRTPPADYIKPSLATALRDQLGLRLEPKNVKLPVYVIESIERPSGN